MRVEAVNPRTRRFDEVIELHRRYRKTLGFLPAGAFAEYAGDGTLLGALADDGLLVGYALYDLPRSEIALRHLCVDAKVRGMGVARALVEELANRHSDRAGIRVRCRRDWDANTMWPRLDFEPLDDRPGRSSEGRLLTTWWRDFGQPNLLSGIPEPGGTAYLAALDTDVFIDLELSRDGGEESRNLLTDWVLELVELVITKEVVQEINNQNDPDVRRKQRGRAVGFRRIDTSDALVKAATQRLLAGLPGPPRTPHDQADVRHVARAHAGGASYFLTRDEQLIRRLGPAAEARLGVQVLTPAMFLRTLWALDQPLAYSPAALANTTFEITAVTAEVEADACKVFVNYREGERLVEFRRKLRALIGSPSVWEVLLVRDASTSPRGLIVRGVAKNVLRVPMIRVAGGSGLTMARHLLHLQRSHATELGLRVVSVDADDVSNEVAAALRDEDFAPGADRWSAATVRAVGTAVDVAPVLNKT
ncbi:MAG: hypothetical protein QOF21_995, partial [Actinomycetota bacterium]